MTNTNDDGYITIESKLAKAKRRHLRYGSRSRDIHETDTVPEQELEEDTDTDFDCLSTNAKLSVILAKLSLNQVKVELIESMLFPVVKKQKHISNIETVVQSHDSRLRLLKYKSLDIEARSRQNNLLIYGFTERRNEDCTDRIMEYLEKDLGLDSAHRAWVETACFRGHTALDVMVG